VTNIDRNMDIPQVIPETKNNGINTDTKTRNGIVDTHDHLMTAKR